ncbi:MAG: hypothetical protein H0U19_01360, partial [Acidobacteria bacterium]|nr:hypothetical protein [Acidobacteriota bacterium]
EVRAQGLWALAPDIEHVLAHRDVRDWYVFEAASWALAEQRMPADKRRERWLEPLPAVVLADRLRGLPLFASVSVDELFRIAAASKQIRHDPGATLIAEGAAPATIHLLLDGTVIATSATQAPQTIGPPAALGFAEALEGAVSSRSLRTSGTAVTLALTTDQLRTMLADNTELVRGLFAEMSTRAEAPGCSPIRATGAATDLARLATDGIVPVEKILALQSIPHFSRASAEEMQQLAAITHTVPMRAGSALFSASSPAATWLVLSGEVRLEGEGPTIAARGGDIIGSFCALSGREVGLTATVVEDGIALRIDRDELFELLGERPDLLRQVFAGMMNLPRPAAAV